jgi:alkylation response protein AidB-like acyl-CoA dehydrogenase
LQYGFTTDEGELIAHLGQLLSHYGTDSTDRATFDGDLWRTLASHGWIAALTATDDAISGSARVALGERFGRAHPALPWTVVLGRSGPLLAGLATMRAGTLLERVHAGEVITIAPDTPSSLCAEIGVDETVTITGQLELVPYAQDAAGILIAGEDRSEAFLAYVPNSSPGVHVTDVPTVELRHRYADLQLTDVVAELVAREDDDVRAALTAANDRYSLMLSAEALGGLSRLLDDTIRYVGERHQFGVPVGSFQAIKHLIAHVATTLENGRALTYLAASASGASSNVRQADDDVAAARNYTGRAYIDGCEQLIQAHGGFGFTWEAGLHTWYRNAMVNFQSALRGGQVEDQHSRANVWDLRPSAMPCSSAANRTGAEQWSAGREPS